MRILVVENDPIEIVCIYKQLPDHDVEIMISYKEFLDACVQDKNSILSFEAVLLSDMFLLKSDRILGVDGLVVALQTVQEGVPYVGMFSRTDSVVSAWAKINNVGVKKYGRLTVAKINKTILGSFLGSLVSKPGKFEKDWAGLLSGLIAARAN